MPYIYALLVSLCTVGAICWTILALRDITRHRIDLERADKQLAMYLVLNSKAQDSWEKVRTQEQVDISQTIYHNVAQAYNLCLTTPQNVILAQIMGYHTIMEREEA